MLEQPEARTLATQIQQTLQGQRVQKVVAGHSPHKFTFFTGRPQAYAALLEGRTLQTGSEVGPYVRLQLEDTLLLLRDGVNPRYYAPQKEKPAKHQLYIQFEDGGALVFTVQMYGSIQAVAADEEPSFDDPYYQTARETPNALCARFTQEYFLQLCARQKPTLSAKALLAAEQRVPGIGNGALQDILLLAGVHPKTKLQNLSQARRVRLWQTTRDTLQAMARQGGRSTEKDLFGNPGGYPVLLSAKSWQNPCPLCGGALQKSAYMGGNVYFCPACQPL